jgi:hypothetical protein
MYKAKLFIGYLLRVHLAFILEADDGKVSREIPLNLVKKSLISPTVNEFEKKKRSAALG